MADIILGNEPAVTVPIQIIDSTFADQHHVVTAGTLWTPLRQMTDTTEFSVSVSLPRTAVRTAQVLQTMDRIIPAMVHRVLEQQSLSTTRSKTRFRSFQLDNNGVILRFPVIPLGGVSSVNGNLILGIDTQSNNSSSGVTMYPADPNSANLTTEIS